MRRSVESRIEALETSSGIGLPRPVIFVQFVGVDPHGGPGLGKLLGVKTSGGYVKRLRGESEKELRDRAKAAGLAGVEGTPNAVILFEDREEVGSSVAAGVTR
jgi:hypothetical protein